MEPPGRGLQVHLVPPAEPGGPRGRGVRLLDQWMGKHLDLAGIFDTGSLIWGLHLAQALRECLIIYQVDSLKHEHGWFRINEVKLLEIPGLLCRTEAKGSGT